MTEITNLTFSDGSSLTARLVADGAPVLPEGYDYRLHIKHPTLSISGPTRAAEVTARIGGLIGDEWVEVARFTEVTRAHLHGATIAAATHAYEVWGRE